MMNELQRLQKYLTVTKNVRDKGVSVDTLDDPILSSDVEQEP
jgi:hypothetical protein